MDVRVEAGPSSAHAVLMESRTINAILSDVTINAPVVSRFTLAPVISIAGHSISSINPEIFEMRIKATA